jgi:hypothetical protein
VGRPESRLALATNWPMNPVEPMIMTPSLASETLGVEPHMIFFFFFFFFVVVVTSVILCFPYF